MSTEAEQDIDFGPADDGDEDPDFGDLEPEPDFGNEQTIFRLVKDKDHPYLMVAKSSINDPRLKLAAVGALMRMLALPDDWRFNIRHLAKLFGVSKDTAGRIVRHIMAAGYVSRDDQPQADGGRFAQATYRLYERPEMNPTTVSQKVGHGENEKTGGITTVSQNTGHGELATTDKEEHSGHSPTPESGTRLGGEVPSVLEGATGPSRTSPPPAPPPPERMSISALVANLQQVHRDQRKAGELEPTDTERASLAGIAKNVGAQRTIGAFRAWCKGTPRGKAFRFFLEDYRHWLPPPAPPPQQHIPGRRECPNCGEPMGQDGAHRCGPRDVEALHAIPTSPEALRALTSDSHIAIGGAAALQNSSVGGGTP